MERNLKIGDSFKNNKFKVKCHIVGFLKEEKIPQIIWKYFGKRKQWWHYQIESMYAFDLSLQYKLYELYKN